MPCVDFNQPAFVGCLAITVENGWGFGVGKAHKTQVETMFGRLRLRAMKGEIDSVARIDLVGVCVMFFHGAVIRRGGQKCKGAAREQVNPCSYGRLCHPRRIEKTRAPQTNTGSGYD